MPHTQRPQYILTNQTTNVSVAASTAWAQVDGESFTVDVWGNFDGATVGLYITAPDGTMVLLKEYTEPTCEFGSVGRVSRRFKAEVTNAGVGTNVSCTLTE